LAVLDRLNAVLAAAAAAVDTIDDDNREGVTYKHVSSMPIRAIAHEMAAYDTCNSDPTLLHQSLTTTYRTSYYIRHFRG